MSAAGKALDIRQQDGVIREPSRCCLLSAAWAGGAAELHRAGALGIANRRRWTPDAACNEDQARNRKGHCAANLSLLRKLALNLARLESGKG